jgi:hypothetical protein
MVASLRDEDLQPVMLNSIALSGAAIQTFSDPLKKMHCYGSKWIANANKKIIRIRGLRIKMFYFLRKKSFTNQYIPHSVIYKIPIILCIQF